jgi:predicted metalloenzyme YecM
MRVKHAIKVPLHDVAGKDQKQYIEVCGLIISELNETIVNKDCIILSKLESPMTAASR